MSISIYFKSSYQSILRSRLRSALTTLGIVIGVASVIIMVSLGNGAKRMVEEQIASLGTNVLMIFAEATTQGGVRTGLGSVVTMVPEDSYALKSLHSINYATPLVRTVQQVVNGSLNWRTAIVGANEEYFLIRDWSIENGYLFNSQHVTSAAKVCVIGKTVAEKLFPFQNPVGSIIRIKGIPFKVLGLLQRKGYSAIGTDQDDTIVIPYTTAQKLLTGSTSIPLILVSASSPSEIDSAKEEITKLLRQRHRISPLADNDFTIRTQAEFASTAERTTKIMMILLGSVASVSLIVGGIGIMNIMLVSVTERTREIGLRRAVGATRRDILLQFLIESSVLSIMGGIVGLLIGIGISSLVPFFIEWPSETPLWSILIAFSFSAIVGISFGLYPAWKASMLNPIEALRYE